LRARPEVTIRYGRHPVASGYRHPEPELGPLRVAEALDDLTVIENDEATVLQAGAIVLLHEVVVELLHVLDHDGLIGHVERDFLQEEQLAVMGEPQPRCARRRGWPDRSGCRGKTWRSHESSCLQT